MSNQLNPTTIKRTIQTKLNKLFEKHFEGTENWSYAPQAKWKGKDIFQRFIHACCENTSIEDVCNDYDGPSADRVQDRTNDLPFDELVQQINDCLQEIAEHFYFHGNRQLVIAVDINDQEYYGDTKREFCVGSKPKNGTCYFNRYLTVSLLTETYRLPVLFLPIRKQDSLRPIDLLHRVFDDLRPWLPFDRVLADGYFYAKEVLDLFDFYDVGYLFNMKNYNWVKQAITDIQEAIRYLAVAAGLQKAKVIEVYKWLKNHALLYWRINHPGTADFSHSPVVVLRVMYRKEKKRGGKVKGKLIFYTYVTNLSLSGQYLKHLYGLRWGIETGYCVIGRFQAFTTSESTSFRTLLMGLAYVLCAVWLYLNLLLNRFPGGNFPTLHFELFFRFSATDRLVLTVRQFQRRLQLSWCFSKED